MSSSLQIQHIPWGHKSVDKIVLQRSRHFARNFTYSVKERERSNSRSVVKRARKTKCKAILLLRPLARHFVWQCRIAISALVPPATLATSRRNTRIWKIFLSAKWRDDARRERERERNRSMEINKRSDRRRRWNGGKRCAYAREVDYLTYLSWAATYICKSLTLTTFPKVPSPRVASTLSAMQKPG